MGSLLYYAQSHFARMNAPTGEHLRACKRPLNFLCPVTGRRHILKRGKL